MQLWGVLRPFGVQARTPDDSVRLGGERLLPERDLRDRSDWLLHIELHSEHGGLSDHAGRALLARASPRCALALTTRPRRSQRRPAPNPPTPPTT